MKKFFAFLLTFAMLFSLAMPAMAAEGDSLSTIYIDVGQLEEAASVQSVYFYTKPDNLVRNEPMTHVGGTIYSYDISTAVAGGATYVEFETFSGDGETKLGSYYTANFETGKNMWTATGQGSGTWSTYNPTGGITINGNTTGDVSASYTPSSTEDTTAKITGLYITVDGVKYESSTAEAPVTIYSDSTVTVTVYGENFANFPEYGNHTNAFIYFGENHNYLWKDSSIWTIDAQNNTATITATNSVLAQATTALELKYTNDSCYTRHGSGIYVIYNEGAKPQPTYTVTIDENIANGTVIADPNSAKAGDTVTLTVTPATGYQIGAVTVKDADGKTVDFTETGVASGKYTFTMPASAVTVTATFEAIPITSAEITWGSMSFTYDDTIDETTNAEKGWSDSDTGWVTVKNTGNTTFTAQASYESTTAEYGTFTGTFNPASSELAAGNSYTFTLELNGKPTKAIPAGTKIGKVTITINEAAEG